ncbi:hypothetical protein [Streptomyces sp. NPDC089799]|uniref:hypothetical protein n=1 Tax=Streptomyces sp. NPDC089799 TaxID=3155066 RepID=UPI00342470D6
MELLPSTAAPGMGERADAVAEAACHLCDAAGPGRWSRAAAEDAVEAIEATANALVTARPGAELILAALHAAVADLRRHLSLPPADPLDAPPLPAGPRTLGNPRRARLGPKPAPPQHPSPGRDGADPAKARVPAPAPESAAVPASASASAAPGSQSAVGDR